MERIHRWYIALSHGNSDQDRWLWEFTDCDETKFHKDADCYDRFGLSIVRNLYEVTREELQVIKGSEDKLKMLVQVFVQEGNGKIRVFNPRRAVKPKRRLVQTATHLFASVSREVPITSGLWLTTLVRKTEAVPLFVRPPFLLYFSYATSRALQKIPTAEIFRNRRAKSIVTALSGALKSEKISHAYLFAGSRGTGKTSVARIFARSLQVRKRHYEIDAASNRGIDDIRALRDAVLTLPFDSKYKVYIVDEVHMLTKEAFNALLKTLEEPPSHVVFILATTEMEKLPETIISRCQVFEFKRPSSELIRTVVSEAAKSEGVTLEGASSELIAIAADGSFRDAYGILERVIASSSGKKITTDTIEEATGAPKRTLVNTFVIAVAEHKWSEALSVLRRAVETGNDMLLLSELIIVELRAILMLSIDSHVDFSKTFSEEDIALAENRRDEKRDRRNAPSFLSAHEHIARAPLPELPLELAVLSLAEKGSDQGLFS